MVDVKWIDIRAIANKHNSYNAVTNLKEEIFNFLYEKYCDGCHKEMYCHEQCIMCDEIKEVLKRVGI